MKAARHISRAAEDALHATVAKARDAEWHAANRAAMECANAWMDECGLPPAEFPEF
jgi:post-segregation antitoxin (ccd killing protein)